MTLNNNLIRYSIIKNKDKREIVLLRGKTCKWGRCRFCDYHLDSSADQDDNFVLNKQVLDRITGIYKKLEVVNSGSFVELDPSTIDYIKKICFNKKISVLICEMHWIYRNEVQSLKREFGEIGVDLKIKSGIETFDHLFRESYLMKGIDESDPAIISTFFDQVCLLFGLPGQTTSSMKNDLETALNFFDRACVNIMTPNSTKISPDPKVIQDFVSSVLPLYKDNPRVDVMLDNTDFGIGGSLV